MGKKLTEEEFLAKVCEKNEHVRRGTLSILGTYQSATTGVETYCNIHNLSFYPTPSNLYNNHGCPKCGYKRVSQKSVDSHDEFVAKLFSVNSDIVVDGEYINSKTKIKVHCQHSHYWMVTPNALLNGQGCPYCSGRQVWTGFNDMWTTHPELAAMLKNKDDGYKYSIGTSKILNFLCKDCGSTVSSRPCEVQRYGLACHFCNDGISYPNKFVRAVLKYLPIINYKPKYNATWCGRFRYDNYFEYNNTKYFIEVDGMHHFKEISNFGRTLEETQQVDKAKEELAKEHEIYMIRINCSQSEPEFIKNSILNSKLNELFDLSRIDWGACEIAANKNVVKYVCDMYDPIKHNIKELMNFFELSDSTIRVYLKRGTKLGWCEYSPSLDICCIRPVALIDSAGTTIMQFASLHECQREMYRIYGVKVYRTCIKDACTNHKPHKGFYFKFIESAIQN